MNNGDRGINPVAITVTNVWKGTGQVEDFNQGPPDVSYPLFADFLTGQRTTIFLADTKPMI